MTAPEQLADRLQSLSKQATVRPWRAFDSGGTLALMKGNRPPSKENGYPCRRWPEVITWTGFDGSDVPMRYRRANLHLIVELANNLPTIIAALRAYASKGTRA